MTSPDSSQRDSIEGTSRRALLRGLGAAPVVASMIASPSVMAIAALNERYGDGPAILLRTKEGREISRRRYHSAEIEFYGIEGGFHGGRIRTTLHTAGSVAKLTLCAHLLDVGFPDPWNAEYIRQDISKVLAYANATGLGHDCPEMARLAVILTPYYKWGYPHLIGDPPMDDGGFTADQVRSLIRALLERVHDVTGHTRPKGWERIQQEFRP
ncbi:hypothetical protein [Novosphingobium terrae]|uniref:hypothetical protein n=1 Tax=Novosphingobium terrae TaxID=2726189 RepID=UPI00197E20E3|nr:hypothetical protein [Novosphingobium terrae]